MASIGVTIWNLCLVFRKGICPFVLWIITPLISIPLMKGVDMLVSQTLRICYLGLLAIFNYVRNHRIVAILACRRLFAVLESGIGIRYWIPYWNPYWNQKMFTLNMLPGTWYIARRTWCLLLATWCRVHLTFILITGSLLHGTWSSSRPAQKC